MSMMENMVMDTCRMVGTVTYEIENMLGLTRDKVRLPQATFPVVKLLEYFKIKGLTTISSAPSFSTHDDLI